MRVPRSKFRAALVIIVPSSIAFIGLFLIGVAGIILADDPFDPSLIVLIGGTIVVVTIALTAILLIDRRERHKAESVDPPPPEL